MFTIRPARKEDASAIIELVVTIGKEFGVYDPKHPVKDIFDVVSAYHDQGGEFLVAEYGGRIVGTIGFHRISKDFVSLRRFYILPEFRGKGIGKELIGRAIVACREKGVLAIITISEISLERALHVYKNAGFVVFKANPVVNYLVNCLDPLARNSYPFEKLAMMNWIFDWNGKAWRIRSS